MEPGARVRLRNDPGRQGVVTSNSRERRGLKLLQVQFTDGSAQFVPTDQLELIDGGARDPLELLESGRLGRASDLRRVLTHVRLSGRLANAIYSLDTTGTDFYAYQYKPVVKLLNSPTDGILIADEVGLGKTIEAGLIWTELSSRFEFSRLLVVCPAMLREKWCAELRKRFGVEAEIHSAAEAHRRLEASRTRGQFDQFAIVASMEGLRPGRGWRQRELRASDRSATSLAHFLAEHQQAEPLVDLVVVDEAHYMRNPETSTFALGSLLRGVTNYMVLLSATPVHLRSRDLFQLLHLVDEDTFDRPQMFDSVLEANAPLVRAREAVLARRYSRADLVQCLTDARSHHLLRSNRQIAEILDAPPSSEELQQEETASRLAYRLERANLLGYAITRTRKRDVTEWRVVRDVVPEAVELTPVEREFYETVTGIVRDYCARSTGHEGFLLVTPQRQMSSSMPAALKTWIERRAATEAELYEDVGLDPDGEYRPEEMGPLVSELVSSVERMGDYKELAANDSKYARLIHLVRSFFSQHSGEKIVLFSYFRGTLSYLDERLRADDVSTFLLRGGVSDKDEIVRAFLEHEGSAVLLSSEVGSEGIDLQRAWVLVNYDLPWNPMKVEQRIGRVDRLGQESPRIQVWNLFARGTIDARIYQRLFERLDIFESALGALEPVLGGAIRELSMDLLRKHLTPEEELGRIEQTAVALQNLRREEEKLEEEAAHLVAHGDYILNQVMAARELNRSIDGKDILAYVSDFLANHFQGTEIQLEDEEKQTYRLRLSHEARFALEAHMRESHSPRGTNLTRTRPGGHRCRFENTAVQAAVGRAEVVSQWHPLVRFVSSRMREEESALHPVVAARVQRSDLGVESIAAGDYVFTVQRWSIRGIQHLERLHYAASLLGDVRGSAPLSDSDAERLVVVAAREGGDWLAADVQVDLETAGQVANEQCLGDSDDAYDAYVQEIDAENQDRADVQEATLEKRVRRELESLHETLERHRRRGQDRMIAPTEGRIRALEARAAQRRQEIMARRTLEHSKDEVCVGVIRVEG